MIYFIMSENIIISSQGIKHICDFVIEGENVLCNGNTTDINEMTDGSLLYVAKEDFNIKILDLLQCKIILVIGCFYEKEYSIGQTENNNDELIELLKSEKIIHCFIQHYYIVHPKVTIMPIGVDYHSYFISNDINEIQQNDMIYQIQNKMTKWEERPKICYVNSEVSVNVMSEISKEVIQYEDDTFDKIEIYKNMSNCLYVVCPYNYGLDSTRIWEAILMNCIPIVLSSENNYFYENLPVLIINNWSDITPELLEDTYHLFQKRYYNIHILKLEYWKERMLSRITLKKIIESRISIYKGSSKYKDILLATFSEIDDKNNVLNIYLKFITDNRNIEI